VIEGPALHDLDAIQRLAFETMAESTRNPMMNALVSDAHARLAAGAWRPLTAFPRTYPSRIYRLGDVRGLCWRRFNGRGPWQLHYDRAAVVEELPAHVVFGPHGQAVADVFEAIARLDPERVRGLPVPDGVSRFQIPVELIADPEGEPLGEQARLASSVAMTWTENRGWAVDGKAGNHYYIGCYFSYQLHEPHWLSAMGRAMNAAVVAALGEVTRADTERVRREWQAVIA